MITEEYFKRLNQEITAKANALAIQQAELEHTSLWSICERYIPQMCIGVEDISRPNDNEERYRFETDLTIRLIPRNNEKTDNENSTVAAE